MIVIVIIKEHDSFQNPYTFYEKVRISFKIIHIQSIEGLAVGWGFKHLKQSWKITCIILGKL